MSGGPQLVDRRLDAEFQNAGFVRLPGRAAPLLDALQAAHGATSSGVPPGFHSTMYSGDREHKEQVHSLLLRILAPLLESCFTGHRPLLTSFVTKGGSGGGAMPPHQDWTFVDEPDSWSWNVWVPLVDVDGGNGAMSLLPGSHRMPLTIRGTDTPNPFAPIDRDVESMMVEVPMFAGDVLVHDHRVLHASPSNLRREPRIVAGCALIGSAAVPIHYRQTAPDTVQRFEVDPEFFREITFGEEDLPSSARWVADVHHVQPQFHLADLPVQAEASGRGR